MSKKIIVTNSTNDGKRLAKKLGDSTIAEFRKEKYPDTESLIAISKKINKPADVIYYQFNNRESFDSQLFNLFCLVDKLAHPRTTRLVLPYLPYGRASVGRNEIDKLLFILKELAKKVASIYVTALHADVRQLRSSEPSLRKLYGIDIDDELIALVKKLGRKENLVLVSPDQGFAGTVARLAKKMSVDHVAFTKHRLSPTKVSMTISAGTKKKIKKLSGKNFVIVDDIVGTGETFRKATALLRSAGIKNVAYVAVHDTRREDSDRKLRVLVSNSLNIAHSTLDITESIARVLRR